MKPENEKVIRALEFALINPEEWDNIDEVFHEVQNNVKDNPLYENPDKWLFYSGMQYGKMLGIRAERKKRKEKSRPVLEHQTASLNCEPATEKATLFYHTSEDNESRNNEMKYSIYECLKLASGSYWKFLVASSDSLEAIMRLANTMNNQDANDMRYWEVVNNITREIL